MEIDLIQYIQLSELFSHESSTRKIYTNLIISAFKALLISDHNYLQSNMSQ